ncbi:hypothetical protein [Chroococcidiopsis sp.]|uniref:hypothetical protein n=1 Tax=Chroococcidiopsis sp. TaxID=3088168 RepID=UPI000B760983|nr:hypothetical protein B7486_49150 [cyanobacterium TDX16]
MITPLHLAASGGVELLDESAKQAFAAAQAWNQLWQVIFQQKQNGLWTAVNYIASCVVAVSFIGFSIYLVEQVVNRNAILVMRHYLWLITAMMLLANNGQLLAEITTDMRLFTATQTQIIFNIQLAGTSVDEAIQDVLVTNDVKDWLGTQYRACEIKTGEAQIQCMEEVGKAARDVVERAESRFGSLGGLRRLWERLSNFKTGFFGNGFNNPLLGMLLGSAAQSAVRWFLKGCQWAASHLFELAMLLTGLYGPIAVAASTLPLPVRPLWAWFIGYISTSLALWSYVLTVGLIAQVIVISKLQEAADIGFLILLGLAAPFLAGAVAAGGGMAVLRAMGSGASTLTSIGFKLLPF